MPNTSVPVAATACPEDRRSLLRTLAALPLVAQVSPSLAIAAPVVTRPRDTEEIVRDLAQQLSDPLERIARGEGGSAFMFSMYWSADKPGCWWAVSANEPKFGPQCWLTSEYRRGADRKFRRW